MRSDFNPKRSAMGSLTRVMLGAGVAMLLGTSSVHAQSSVSDQADMFFRVINPLSHQTIRHLDFGKVGPGVPKTITPSDERAALVEFTGENLMDVKVAIQVPTELVSGANTMPFTGTAQFMAEQGDAPVTLDVRGVDQGGGWFEPAQLKIGTSTVDGVLSDADDLMGEIGNIYLNLGGSVTPANDQARGEYSGQITVTMTYMM